MKNSIQRHDRQDHHLIEMWIGGQLVYMRVPKEGNTFEIETYGGTFKVEVNDKLIKVECNE